MNERPFNCEEQSLLTAVLPLAIEAKMIEEFERIKAGF